MPRVAVDLLGGDGTPDLVVDGVLAALADVATLSVVLVGPPDLARGLLADRGAPRPDLGGRIDVVAADQVVGMAEDPVRGVRSKRNATVRVATRLVRDGAADAAVSIGSTGAALAAAVFTLGTLPGITRPALALVVQSRGGPLVLLDVGATPDATPDLLAQFALTGAAYAAVRLGVDRPRVGLLSIGTEPGKGDALRRAAYEILSGLPVDFAGTVEGHTVPLGGAVDVIVTDGFTGNVLLKGLEGAVQAVTTTVGDALSTQIGGGGDLARIADAYAADAQGGAVLLGVDGLVVVGHGRSSPAAVAACVRAAARAVADDLLPRLRTVTGELVARRRAAAGLPA